MSFISAAEQAHFSHLNIFVQNIIARRVVAFKISVDVLPDDGGHDLCSEEDAEGGGGLGGEETQH